MTHPTRGGDPLSLDGGELGILDFTWQGDRYHHQWRFGSSSEASVVSIESCSADAWPASPPLQQIHQQSFADGRRVIFGVGMAGRGHWSASFTLIPDLHCWIVELACRAPHEPEHLASSYSLSGQWDEQPAGSLTSIQNQQRVELQPIAPGSIGKRLESNWIVSPAALASGSATHQWAFRLRRSAA